MDFPISEEMKAAFSSNQTDLPLTEEIIDTNPPLVPAVEEQLTELLDNVPAEVIEQIPVEDTSLEIELSEEQVSNWLEKQKGKKLTELLATPDIQVNEFDGIDWDDKDIAYLQYKKETGRGYDDFISLNRDLSSLSDLDLARERVRNETGKELTNDQVDVYLEKKLGIVDITDIDDTDAIELAAYTKSIREQKIADQQKYAVPKEKPVSASTEAVAEDNFVTLQDGSKMPKEAYATLEKSRNEYIVAMKTAANSVAPVAYQIEIDNNGTPEIMAVEYEFDKEDKHSMLSASLDLSDTVEKLFRTESGFDFAGLQTSAWFLNPKNREKFATAIANASRAKAIEEMLKAENNISFARNSLDKSKNTEKKTDIFSAGHNGFGVKYDFSN